MTDTSSPAFELTQQANAWVARLTSGQATVEDARALREWCARSAAHAQAYHEAARLWRELGRLPPVAARRAPRRRVLGGGLAACALLLGFAWLQPGQIDAQAWLADASTGVGERREILLEDGSRVELDARSSLDLDFSAERRRLVLKGGAAVFHVQHDPGRPFVVEADNGSVTALGTVFEVRHQDNGVRVTCSEGVVAVRSADRPPLRLEAGQQLRYDTRASSPPAPVNSAEALAWRQDLLVFKQRPLAELVEELNRYRSGRIVLANQQIAQRPVSGVFHLQRTDEALAHISSSLGLSATHLPGNWVMLR
ncbi:MULTISPECIES: FecR family protein [unclassified Pseudomonas]|uniref:FecR family protein n=1 Tax=unclassified Pseudomonas TaxID=196821 RepID=UPI0024470B1C|nr:MULTISPECIES: FecR family protein [unclassified Pseudomonas]MDG9925058.1 FecR family protein [Pseudomonas sp. GD04045]MDH0037067.1 FecR family protein [Pseudomonas sp. GD04019]